MLLYHIYAKERTYGTDNKDDPRRMHQVSHADQRRNNPAESERNRSQQCRRTSRIHPSLIHSQCCGRSEAKPQRKKDTKHKHLIHPKTASGKQSNHLTHGKDQQPDTPGKRPVLHPLKFHGQRSSYHHRQRINPETDTEIERCKPIMFLHNKRCRSNIGKECSLGEPKLQHVPHVRTVSK